MIPFAQGFMMKIRFQFATMSPRDRSDKGFQGLKPNSAHFYRRIEALRLPRGRGEIDSVQKDRQDL